MRYRTTLEVARELNVTKQTLLNWLYAKKVPEPPRSRSGSRLWSEARVTLIRQQIREGRLHNRTTVHRDASAYPLVVAELASEVSQFLKDADVPLWRFFRELQDVHRPARRRVAKKKPEPRDARARRPPPPVARGAPPPAGAARGARGGRGREPGARAA